MGERRPWYLRSRLASRTLRIPFCILLMGCAGAATPRISALPETVSDRPLVGRTCTETSRIRGSRQDLVARFEDAFSKLDIHAAKADTLPLRIVVGGSGAPAGTGSSAARAARLYIAVFGIRDVKPDATFPTWYTVTSGIYSAPRDISDADRTTLYRQAYRLTQSVLAGARLDTLHCGT